MLDSCTLINHHKDVKELLTRAGDYVRPVSQERLQQTAIDVSSLLAVYGKLEGEWSPRLTEDLDSSDRAHKVIDVPLKRLLFGINATVILPVNNQPISHNDLQITAKNDDSLTPIYYKEYRFRSSTRPNSMGNRQAFFILKKAQSRLEKEKLKRMSQT